MPSFCFAAGWSAEGMFAGYALGCLLLAALPAVRGTTWLLTALQNRLRFSVVM